MFGRKCPAHILKFFKNFGIRVQNDGPILLQRVERKKEVGDIVKNPSIRKGGSSDEEGFIFGLAFGHCVQRFSASSRPGADYPHDAQHLFQRNDSNLFS